MLVAIAQVILAELPGHIALILQQLGERNIFLLQALFCAREADLEKTGTERRLAGNKSGSPGSAALLAVEVSEKCAFSRKTIIATGLIMTGQAKY